MNVIFSLSEMYSIYLIAFVLLQEEISMSASNINMTFSDKLKNSLLRCFGNCDDPLKALCGLPSIAEYSIVILSTFFCPQELFDRETIQYLGSGSNGESWLINLNEKSVVWITAERSAGSVMDICLGLSKLNCGHILYLGEAISLNDSIPLGSLVVPNKAVSGTGATRYLCDDMTGDPTFMQERRTPPKGILWLSKAAIHTETALKTCTVFSADSILGAMMHLNTLNTVDAETLDCFSSAFSRCMILLERPGVVLLSVTRQLTSNDHLAAAEEAALSSMRESVRKLICAMA